MLGSDVLVVEPFGLFRAISENALAFVAQGKIDRGGNLLPNGGVTFDLLANGFDGGVRPQEAVGQSLILAQQAEQKMLGFDVRAAELARLVSRKEDHSSRFLRITLKHIRSDAPLLLKDTPARLQVAKYQYWRRTHRVLGLKPVNNGARTTNYA